MRRGMTLVEMMVTLFLFSLIALIAAALFTETVRTFMTRGQSEEPRHGRLVVKRLSAAVRNCDRMLDPSYYGLQRRGKTGYFVLRERVPSGYRVVGYRPGQGGLEERIYDVDYQAGDPDRQKLQSVRTLRGASGLELELEDERYPTLVTLRLAGHTTRINFRTSQ